MRFVFLLISFLGASSSPAFASWWCEGSCNTSCFHGTMGRAAPTESAARRAMDEACTETGYKYEWCQEGQISANVTRCYEQGGGVPSGPKKYYIQLRNNCSKHGQIWTAIYMRDLEGTWDSKGYWGLEYGETANIGYTTNRIFYFHGHTDGGIVWGGEVNQEVRGTSRPFNKHTIPESASSGNYLFNYTCN